MMEGPVMRAPVGCSICLAAITASIAYAGAQIESTPIHLLSFYKIDKMGTATWQLSDSSPWYAVKNADWVNPGVLKLGYVPVVHDSKHYYCLIDKIERIGSRFPKRAFLCGDPLAVESVVNNNYRVTRTLPDWEQGDPPP
jgi:hypothetical protein